MADKASSSSNPPPSPQGQKSLPSSSGEPPSIVNPQPPPSAAASAVPASSFTSQPRRRSRRPSNVQLPFVVGFIPDFTFNNIDFREIINQDLSPSPSPKWSHHSSSPSNPLSSPKPLASPPSDSGELPCVLIPQPPPSAASSTDPVFSSIDQPLQEPPRHSRLSVYSALKQKIYRSISKRPSFTALNKNPDPPRKLLKTTFVPSAAANRNYFSTHTGQFSEEHQRPSEESRRHLLDQGRSTHLRGRRRLGTAEVDLTPPSEFDLLVREVSIVNARVEELNRRIQILLHKPLVLVNPLMSSLKFMGPCPPVLTFPSLFLPPPNIDYIIFLFEKLRKLEASVEARERELRSMFRSRAKERKGHSGVSIAEATEQQGPLTSDDQTMVSGDPFSSSQTNDGNKNEDGNGNGNENLSSDTEDKPSAKDSDANVNDDAKDQKGHVDDDAPGAN